MICKRAVDKVGNGYRLSMLGDLNGWIGNRIMEGITGPFGVKGEKMIMAEEGFIYVLKRGCVWVKHTSSSSVYIST